MSNWANFAFHFWTACARTVILLKIQPMEDGLYKLLNLIRTIKSVLGKMLFCVGDPCEGPVYLQL
jgi:hypothetical protein